MSEINGTSGNDSLLGTDGDDSFFGGQGDDTFVGGDGSDWAYYEPGDDFFNGGSGNNRFDYRDAPGGISANLITGIISDGGGGTDTIVDVNRIIGSDFDDLLIGNDQFNSFTGELGNDTIDGGSGLAFVWYGRAPGAVQINLTTGVVTGAEGTDSLSNVNDVSGGNYSDLIYGNNESNYFELDQPDDIYTPNYMVGGADTVDGMGGNDIVSFRNAVAGVTIDLAAGTAIDSRGNTDTLISIEQVRGGDHGDSIAGSDADETLVGNGGDDTIADGLGDDSIDGGDGDDLFLMGRGFDTYNGGDGEDTVEVTVDDDPDAFSVNANLNTGEHFAIEFPTNANDSLISIEHYTFNGLQDVLVTGTATGKPARDRRGQRHALRACGQ